jgi:hypothetical protein
LSSITAALTRYYIGLDLGLPGEYSALTIVRQTRSEPEKVEDSRYECVALTRYSPGTSYPAILSDVQDLLKKPPLNAETRLSLDETGAGRAVTELFKQAGLEPVVITITAGFDTLAVDSLTYHTPKRDLVSSVQVLLQSGRLKIARRLPDAGILEKELLNFKFKVPLNAADDFTYWREGAQDDLVFALCIACWTGENVRGPGKLEEDRELWERIWNRPELDWRTSGRY